MNTPFFQMCNNHSASCGQPPTITNESRICYFGYFENRYGEQWVFVYDPERMTGELRGGDIGWDTVVKVQNGQVDLTLGKDEAAWLEMCWMAATFRQGD